MKKSRLLFAVLTLLLIGASFARHGLAFSIREMLGLEEEDAAVAAETTESTPADTGTRDWGKPSHTGAEAALEMTQVQAVVANLAPNQRQALLADAKAFQRFARQEADNISVLAAARANNADKEANTAFLMQRSAESILRESYMNRLVAGKIPADFPTETQTKEYFDKNRDKLVIGERIHVWQVFLPSADAKDEKAVAALQKQADGIAADISQGKLDFAAAASRYSAHEPSRNNGGYMGLLAVKDMKPEIGKALQGLGEGALSKPIRTDSGFHILRRGGSVAGRAISYDEAKDQIRQLLVSQARSQLRKAIYEQARQSYPVALTDTKIEEWRLRLRTNLQAASAASQKPVVEKKQ
ncbi:MAG: peptidylprolyl isomerase [Gammaproteobacteria bacterium]|nr:peptidylprolyl isomerase [Gammaproteobacteria bacterium]